MCKFEMNEGSVNLDNHPPSNSPTSSSSNLFNLSNNLQSIANNVQNQTNHSIDNHSPSTINHYLATINYYLTNQQSQQTNQNQPNQTNQRPHHSQSSQAKKLPINISSHAQNQQSNARDSLILKQHQIRNSINQCNSNGNSPFSSQSLPEDDFVCVTNNLPICSHLDNSLLNLDKEYSSSKMSTCFNESTISNQARNDQTKLRNETNLSQFNDSPLNQIAQMTTRNSPNESNSINKPLKQAKPEPSTNQLKCYSNKNQFKASNTQANSLNNKNPQANIKKISSLNETRFSNARSQPINSPQRSNSQQTSNDSLHNIIGVDEEGKPMHSYIGLIAQAILRSKERRLVLSEIYGYILERYPYFKDRTGWRNSIRHNLSLNDCFVKGPRAANGKGHYWHIHPANLRDFLKGDFRRRRAQRKVRRHLGLGMLDTGLNEDDEDSEDEELNKQFFHQFTHLQHLNQQIKFNLEHNLQANLYHLSNLNSNLVNNTTNNSLAVASAAAAAVAAANRSFLLNNTSSVNVPLIAALAQQHQQQQTSMQVPAQVQVNIQQTPSNLQSTVANLASLTHGTATANTCHLANNLNSLNSITPPNETNYLNYLNLLKKEWLNGLNSMTTCPQLDSNQAATNLITNNSTSSISNGSSNEPVFNSNKTNNNLNLTSPVANLNLQIINSNEFKFKNEFHEDDIEIDIENENEFENKNLTKQLSEATFLTDLNLINTSLKLNLNETKQAKIEEIMPEELEKASLSADSSFKLNLNANKEENMPDYNHLDECNQIEFKTKQDSENFLLNLNLLKQIILQKNTIKLNNLPAQPQLSPVSTSNLATLSASATVTSNLTNKKQRFDMDSLLENECKKKLCN